MYHGPQSQREGLWPCVPAVWSHIFSLARSRTLCTSVPVLSPPSPHPNPGPYHPMSLECCILQHWVKNIPHKLYWEKQTWSSLGWGNWLQVFYFSQECCSHFSLHSRQAAVTAATNATTEFSEDPLLGGMGTQMHRSICGLQENQVAPLETCEWDVMPTHVLCSDPGAKRWSVMSVGNIQEHIVVWLEPFEGIHWIWSDSVLSQSLFRSQWWPPQLAWQV